MTNKQIMSLVALVVVACSTVLCWPTDYNAASSFYRAMIINIINVFIVEIPNLKHGKKRWMNVIKSILVVFGAVMVGIGFLHISNEDTISCGEYVYFFLSLFVCVLSVLRFGECMLKKEQRTPAIVDVVTDEEHS